MMDANHLSKSRSNKHGAAANSKDKRICGSLKILTGPATDALERYTKRRRTMDTACSSSDDVSDQTFSPTTITTSSRRASTDCCHMRLKNPPSFNVDALFDAISATETKREEVFPTIGWNFDDNEAEEARFSKLDQN